MARIYLYIPNTGGGGTNPTTNFIPVNNNGVFKDSSIYDDSTRLYAEDNEGFGLQLDYDGNVAKMGDVNSNLNESFININDNNKLININAGAQTTFELDGNSEKITLSAKTGVSFIKVDEVMQLTTLKNNTILLQTDSIILYGAVTSSSVGIASGLYLELIINSTVYKIPLFLA